MKIEETKPSIAAHTPLRQMSIESRKTTLSAVREVGQKLYNSDNQTLIGNTDFLFHVHVGITTLALVINSPYQVQDWTTRHVAGVQTICNLHGLPALPANEVCHHVLWHQLFLLGKLVQTGDHKFNSINLVRITIEMEDMLKNPKVVEDTVEAYYRDTKISGNYTIVELEISAELHSTLSPDEQPLVSASDTPTSIH